MNIAENMTDLVGNTPLVKINKLHSTKATILAKLEFFNPAGSVKDRIGCHMIKEALRRGDINQETVIVEPTSGNTGIALAWVCAVLDLSLILTMPQSMSKERRDVLKALGAQMVLTEPHEGMAGAIRKAHEILEETKNGFMPSQFSNPNNPEVHRLTTAEEIWKDTDGQVDFFVTGVGTGGTISGVGKVLKEKKSSVRVYAVEPEASSVISGKEPGPHMIQGIGAGFVPENYDASVVDDVFTVSCQESKDMANKLAQKEGIFCGISSGANILGALRLAEQYGEQAPVIVTTICDLGDRYFSSGLFDS